MLQNRMAAFVFVWAVLGLTTSGLAKEKLYTLESARAKGQIDKVQIDKVQIAMEIRGELRLSDDASREMETAPMELTGKTIYFERTIATPTEPKGHSRAARAYKLMEATVKIGKTENQPKLRPERRWIGVQLDGANRTLFSPEGELTREELELLETPVDTLLLERLLPPKPVTLGSSWDLPEATAAILTGLDRIKEGRFACKLTEIDAHRALVEIRGTVEGANKGVGATFRVKAKYRFDRGTNRIDWLGLVFEEQRDIGHVEAGCTAIARLQLKVTPLSGSALAAGTPSKTRKDLPESAHQKLSDTSISKMTFPVDKPLPPLAFLPQKGNWHLTHDRRWYEHGNDRTLGVLRLVDRGDLIAQCNVATLETTDPEALPTLEKYQEDIKKALGDHFGKVVAYSKKANDQDYMVYEVIVQGTAGEEADTELPIQWQYYLVVDRHGRQVALTFTVEPDLVPRLGTSARQMVDAIRFNENLAAASDGSIKK